MALEEGAADTLRAQVASLFNDVQAYTQLRAINHEGALRFDDYIAEFKDLNYYGQLQAVRYSATCLLPMAVTRVADNERKDLMLRCQGLMQLFLGRTFQQERLKTSSAARATAGELYRLVAWLMHAFDPPPHSTSSFSSPTSHSASRQNSRSSSASAAPLSEIHQRSRALLSKTRRSAADCNRRKAAGMSQLRRFNTRTGTCFPVESADILEVCQGFVQAYQRRDPAIRKRMLAAAENSIKGNIARFRRLQRGTEEVVLLQTSYLEAKELMLALGASPSRDPTPAELECITSLKFVELCLDWLEVELPEWKTDRPEPSEDQLLQARLGSNKKTQLSRRAALSSIFQGFQPHKRQESDA